MRTKSTFLFNAALLCVVVLLPASHANGQSVPITNPANGQLIISEFRLRGPNGANDEFVEVYNTTNTTIRVTDQGSDAIYQAQCALSSSCGWALTDVPNIIGGSAKFIIPNGVEIPPYGHYLIANTGAGGYSLGGYATPNGVYNQSNSGVEISDNTGIAIFKTAYTAAFDGSNDCLGGTSCVLDAVGFGNDPAPFRENTGLTVLSPIDKEFSYARKVTTTGYPQDTNNNASDFWLVSTDATVFDACSDAPICTTYANTFASVLGAPGPENLSSPVNRTSQLKSSLIEPAAGSLGGANAVRDSTPGTPGSPTAFGTLTLRRRFTNTTGGAVTKLRLRVTNITTINSPGAGATQADIRALTSATQSISVTNNGVTTEVDVRKATLEEPPTQEKGGGYHSSLLVDIPGVSLINGNSVVVNIRFGVAKGGAFSLAYVVEALLAPSSGGLSASPATSATSATKTGGNRSKLRN